MLTDYLIIVAAVTTGTLIWRNIKIDHPSFSEKVRSLPLIGGSLSCGFCFALWASLGAVVYSNPLIGWNPDHVLIESIFPVANFFVSWFAVGAGVLLFRSVIIVLLELGAIVKHQHAAQHGKGH